MATRGSAAWRKEAWGSPCPTADIIAIQWLPGMPPIWAHRACDQAFRVLGQVFRRHCYTVRPKVTGAYNCRAITGGSSYSAHAWGISLDVNWDTNPYRTDKLVTDMPPALREDIENIRTAKTGAQVFRGGWDWDGRPDTPHSNYDAMHIEVIATPAELAEGILMQAFDVGDSRTWPVLVKGDRGEAVEMLQAFLHMAADGAFGDRTLAAVASWQRTRGLTVDGVVGPQTWTSIISRQPPLRPGDVRPSK